MSSDIELCDFVWQYERRKKWWNYSVEEINLLNKAVKDKKESLFLPCKNERNQIVVSFDKMVQINRVTLYEQRVRCLVCLEDAVLWVWENNCNWYCYKPHLVFHLEMAYTKKKNKMQFHDTFDFEVNLETFKQVNEDTDVICDIKRETIKFPFTTQLDEQKLHNQALFKQISSADFDIPSAKRICLDSSSLQFDDEQQLSLSVPVDLEFQERENFHIYTENNVQFSAILNQTNLQNNNNKFYIIQLLEHNQKKQFSVWRRWGRVGQRGQRDYSNYRSSLSEAKLSFEKKFYDKTRNDWDDKENFVHVKGKYDLVQAELAPVDRVVKKVDTSVKSNLNTIIQSLLELICDQKRMEETMKEMLYDSNRTPLGKLTLKQIQEGYSALHKIADAVSSGKKGSVLLNACNEFYTKIPHNFGMKTPPLISTLNDVQNKLKMLEALSNIAVAMGVLNSKSDTPEHPLDKCYNSLNCMLEILDRNSAEYFELETCLKETHGPTHTNYEMEIVDAFKCYKEQEESSFINYENKYLLWHGSRITNWIGILKQGLQIAPPEAPCTGYMFGKGVYFADVSSKSANYCYATKRKNEGLLLLCEVSVGKQFCLAEAAENMPVGLPSDYNSVLGKGRILPKNFKTGKLASEAKAPFGPLEENSTYKGSLIYNEYVIYNTKQVKLKYLLRIKFNFK